MADNPRGRSPFDDRHGRVKKSSGNRADESRRDIYSHDRTPTRSAEFGDRSSRVQRREPRVSSPQTTHRRAVHYQVVTMDDEEWGDALEQRLNGLGQDGWRLVAIDEGRQYVFMHGD